MIFFSGKIIKIRNDNIIRSFEEIGDHIYPDLSDYHGALLHEFSPAMEDELKRIVMASPSSSCELYSVPTWLLKESLPVFLPSLPSISRIRRYLDQDSAKTIVHAYAISRLDYANSLLYNINSNLLHRLQIVQNTAARIILIILKATPHDRATHCFIRFIGFQ